MRNMFGPAEEIELYDDDGNEVTNPATLRALAEAQQIIRDDMVRWRLTHGVGA